MFNTDSNDLDLIAFNTLLLFSGGQMLTVFGISEVSKHPVDEMWRVIKVLQGKKYIKKSSNGKFVIDEAGVDYLLKRGVEAEMEEEPPDPEEFKKHLPFSFKDWKGMAFWFLPLAILIALPFFVHYYFLSESIFFHILAGLAALVLLVLYFKFSHRHLLENERLVLFYSGKPYHEKGPGHVLFFPIFYVIKEVDIKERSLEITDKKCSTKDNMPLLATLHITWEVIEAIPFVTKAANAEDSLHRAATASLNSSISEYTLDEAQRDRGALSKMIETKITKRAYAWGVQIKSVTLSKLSLPDLILEGLVNKRKAILESEAFAIKESKRQEMLANLFRLSEIMARNPQAALLKYLDTLEKIGASASAKYLIPTEFFGSLRDLLASISHPTGNSEDEKRSTAFPSPDEDL